MFAKKKLDAEGKSDARADQKLLIFFVWPYFQNRNHPRKRCWFTMYSLVGVIGKPSRPVLPDNITIPYISQAKINCTVVSTPPAQITWYSVNPAMNTTIKIQKSQYTTSVLTLKWGQRLTDGVMERYFCRASNRFGKEEKYIMVMAAEPPPGLSQQMKIVIGVSCVVGVFFILGLSLGVRKSLRKLRDFAPHLSPDDSFRLDPNKFIYYVIYF